MNMNKQEDSIEKDILKIIDDFEWDITVLKDPYSERDYITNKDFQEGMIEFKNNIIDYLKKLNFLK